MLCALGRIYRKNNDPLGFHIHVPGNLKMIIPILDLLTTLNPFSGINLNSIVYYLRHLTYFTHKVKQKPSLSLTHTHSLSFSLASWLRPTNTGGGNICVIQNYWEKKRRRLSLSPNDIYNIQRVRPYVV